MIEFEVKRKKDVVLVNIIYSDDPEFASQGSVFEIDRQKFEQCVEMLKKSGIKDAEDKAVFSLAFYNRCLA